MAARDAEGPSPPTSASSKRGSPPPAHAPPGSALCTQCGLCCTGALHDAAVLDPTEIPHAKAMGLPVLNRRKPGFGLPCPMLSGTLCSIYGDRPKVCGRYKCKLLQEFEAGEIEYAEGAARIRTAKALSAEAEAEMPKGMTLPQARTVGRAALPSSPRVEHSMDDGKNIKLRLRTIALDLYLDKFFRNSRDVLMLELNRIGNGENAAEKK